MNMKVLRICGLSAAMALMASVATEGEASAWTVGGFGGKAVWSADNGCFQDVSGGAANLWCGSSSKNWVVYPAVRWSGAVSASASINVVCTHATANSNGSGYGAAPWKLFVVSGETLTLGMGVPGKINQVVCNVPSNGVLYSVSLAE